MAWTSDDEWSIVNEWLSEQNMEVGHFTCIVNEWLSEQNMEVGHFNCLFRVHAS